MTLFTIQKEEEEKDMTLFFGSGLKGSGGVSIHFVVLHLGALSLGGYFLKIFLFYLRLLAASN